MNNKRKNEHTKEKNTHKRKEKEKEMKNGPTPAEHRVERRARRRRF
jgi:hypothetical protein